MLDLASLGTILWWFQSPPLRWFFTSAHQLHKVESICFKELRVEYIVLSHSNLSLRLHCWSMTWSSLNAMAANDTGDLSPLSQSITKIWQMRLGSFSQVICRWGSNLYTTIEHWPIQGITGLLDISSRRLLSISQGHVHQECAKTAPVSALAWLGHTHFLFWLPWTWLYLAWKCSTSSWLSPTSTRPGASMKTSFHNRAFWKKKKKKALLL